MKQDQFRAFLQPEKPLPDGVLPMQYAAGTKIPFPFIRELGYWPDNGQGLTQEACEKLFVACGLEGRYGARYHATMINDLAAQLEHAREFAYRFREHLIKKAEEQEFGPDPSRPLYLKEDTDGRRTLHLHDAWKGMSLTEQTAIDMFLAYGLDPEQGRRWYAIHHYRTTHPRFDYPFNPFMECASYAFSQGKQLKTTGKTSYPMDAAATIPAPVDFEWVYSRFKANKLWWHNAKDFWHDMDKRNWSYQGKAFTPEELADMIDKECRAEHERQSRPQYPLI